MKNRALLLFAFLAGCGAAPQAPEVTVDSEVESGRGPWDVDVGKYLNMPERIDVEYDGVDLADVMEDIGKRVGRNVIVDTGIQETVRVSMKDVHWREAVEVLARMTRCYIYQPCGTLILRREPADVRLAFTDANVRTVLQRIASYGRTNIMLGDDVRARVSIDISGRRPWLAYIEALVRACGFHAELSEGMLTITGPQRSSGDDTDLDGLPAQRPAPPPQGRPPRNVLRARGVSLETWTQALAPYAHKELLVVGDAKSTVDVDLENTHWFLAMLQATSQAGADVIQEGDLLSVKLPAEAARRGTGPTRFRLLLPGGRMYKATIEATVVVPRSSDEKGTVIIADRIYREGDTLIDEQDPDAGELPVVVSRIGTQFVRFQVEGGAKPVPVRFPPAR